MLKGVGQKKSDFDETFAPNGPVCLLSGGAGWSNSKSCIRAPGLVVDPWERNVGISLLGPDQRRNQQRAVLIE